MDTTTCLILLSGVVFQSSCLLHHPLLVEKAETWSNARSYCRETCVDLVTIDDMEEMEAAFQAFQGRDVTSVWMGIQKGRRLKWHWSLTGKNLYKEGEKNYFNWENNLKNRCGLFEKGMMYSINCPTTLRAICFYGKKLGSERYILTSTHMDWTSSRDFCRENFDDLASVRNEEESQILQKVAGDRGVWIGLFEDYWVWSDGAESSFRYWTEDIKVYDSLNNPACAASLPQFSGKWMKSSCDTTRPFLCNCVPRFRYFFKVAIRLQDAGLDMQDPSVQDKILEHIKQQLINARQTEDFQIQWRNNPGGKVFIRDQSDSSEHSSTC